MADSNLNITAVHPVPPVPLVPFVPSVPFVPYQLENCKKMVLPNPGKWSIQGHSKAGERTGFWLEPLNVVLDIGLSTNKVPKCIFLTHSHTDHSDQIANIYSVRTVPGKNQEGLVGRLLVMSEHCVPLIKRHLENVVDRSRGILNFCQKLEEELNYDKSVKEGEDITDAENRGIVWNIQGTHPYVAKPGMILEDIPGLTNISVEVVPCLHSVPSQGYGFSTISNKLKQEYKGLKGQELGKLKKEGINITEKVLRPELIFFGDTNAKALLEDSSWKKYPVIIVECTMFDDQETLTELRLEEHIAWFQVEPVVKENPGNYFVFIHSSESVDDEFLTKFQKDKKKKLGLDNFCIWTDLEVELDENKIEVLTF